MILKDYFSVHPLGKLTKQVNYGFTASAIQSGNSKFLRITDIQDDRVNWDTVPYCNCGEKDRKKYVLEPGDIVFARTGATTGKSFLIQDCPKDSVFASYLIRVRPSSSVNPKYLAWFFQTPHYWNQITKNATGSTQPGVNATNLKQLKVPLPPVEEQKRIAAILDKADAIRRSRKKAIALTEELLRSTFLDMFGDPVTNPKGWDKMSLGELVPQKGQIVDGPFGSSLKPECYVADGVRVVRNFNIQDDFFDKSEFVYVTEEKFSEIKRSNVEYGDLLFSTKGTIGNVCIMPKLESKSVLSASGTVRIRFPETSKVLPEFAVQQMVQKNYKQYMKWFEAGTNQKYLNLSGIRKMELIVPPLELQQKFLNLRTENYSLKSRNNTTFIETENFFNSLLQKAFRGEL